MKAARAYPITEHTTDLRVEWIEDPTPGAGEVLVQVTAAGVTRWDHNAATGAGPGPLTLGAEGAGVVVADPAGHWAPGTRVMFFAGSAGTMAEFAVVPEQNLAEVAAREPYYDEFRNDGQAVRLYGDTALIVGVTHIRGKAGGEAFAADFRYTDTWIRRDGRWRLAASHASRLP